MANIPVGLQLYTLRDELNHDFIGTLKKVADIGYKVVEFAGYGDIPAIEMKKVLADLGLTASSSHVGLPFGNREQLASTLSYHIDYNKEIGSQYIVVPWAALDGMTTVEELNPFIEDLRFAAEECHRQQIGFAYHNHAFEFNKIGEKTIHERIFEAIEPELLVAELDLYWVKKAGLDPKSYLCKFKDRSPIIHVKDMTADERGVFCEVGRGIINYPAIFELAEGMGVQTYIVEQDVCERPPMESIKISFDYLKSLGVA